MSPVGAIFVPFPPKTGTNFYIPPPQIVERVVSKHQIQPECEDEQADAGWDCRTLSRDQILRHERGQRNIHFSCSADHMQDWQPYPVDPYSCYMCDNTYIARARINRVRLPILLVVN